MTPSEDELEHMLTSLPARRLSDASIRRVCEATDQPVNKPMTHATEPFWRRGIPLWLAAAACLLLSAGTAAFMYLIAAATDRPEQNPQRLADSVPAAPRVVEIAASPRATLPMSSTDIARWTRIDLRTESSS